MVPTCLCLQSPGKRGKQIAIMEMCSGHQKWLKKDSSSLLRASGMVSPGGAAQAETEEWRPFWSGPEGK